MESPTPHATGRWAERLATVPDLNGDGRNEILIGVPSEDFGGFTNAGRVYMQDGATRSLIYFIDAPQIQAAAQFGFYIAVIGDVNGDRRADFAAGTDAQDTLADGTPCTPPAAPAPLGSCNQDQGKAWVFNGTNGHTLYALNNPRPQGFARFGSRIGRAGDINADGVADVIVGASNNDNPAGCGNDPTTGRAITVPPPNCRVNEGEAFIFSGTNGALLRTLNLPASDRAPAPCGPGAGRDRTACGGFGLAVQGFGDANRDGVVDQLINASSFNFDTATGGPCADPSAATCNRGQGAMYVFSGADGTLIRRTDDPAPQAGAIFGFQDAEPLAPGDVNRDGSADYYGNGFIQNGPAGDEQTGRAWVFSGETGAVLYEVKDPTPALGGQFGWSLARTDYNKDGTPDLYVGQSPHHVAGGGTAVNQSGGTYVFDGRDGSLLKALELPPSDAQPGAPGNNGSNLGWGIAAPGDLNGDGEPDYAASAPFTDVGPSAFNCPAPTPGCVQDVGREFFFYSNVPPAAPDRPAPPAYPQPAAPFADCPSATANVIRGSATNDRINGTPQADRIFAGTGNDIVDGLTADDCIDLGPGTDRGQGGDGRDLLLGGLGADRMSGNRGADRLRGGAAGDRLIGGFGDDTLHGQSGADRVNGERGGDRINGGSGGDVISAGSSDDRVAGDQGNDRINGNSGEDVLKGNSGRDRISGSSGADRMSGGGGDDRISARDGRRDRVNCGRGRDTVIADRLDRVARNCERVRRR